MSEGDRAAKAARAKAMLKRHQQQKKGTELGSAVSSGPPPSNSPPPAATRTEPHSPPDNGLGQRNDIEDVFGKVDVGDSSWIVSLPRVGSPPSQTSQTVSTQRRASLKAAGPGLTHTNPSKDHNYLPTNQLRDTGSEGGERTNAAGAAASLQHIKDLESKLQEEETLLQRERARNQELESHVLQLENDVQSQHQTIALLVSEKASLSASLEHLGNVQASNEEKDARIQQVNGEMQAMNAHVQNVETEAREANKLVQMFLAKEQELMDKSREQERELQLLTANLNVSRSDSDRHQRRVRELEEQIQSDDRVERLEDSLKHTQDRADELDFQFSKLKQSYAALKLERDEIEAGLHAYRDNEAEWRSKHTALQAEHSAAQSHFALFTSNYDSLLSEKMSLETQVDQAQKEIKHLQKHVVEAASEHDVTSKQLQNLQFELRVANRRAEQAEALQKALQSEGMGLMQSLEEMRTKVVELTDTKLEMSEKLEASERALSDRDAVIAQMEASAQEARNETGYSEKQHQELLAVERRKCFSMQENVSELQRAYEEVQAELDRVQGKLSKAEVDKATHHRTASRHLEEIDRLNVSSATNAMDLSTTQLELEERKAAEEERQGILERAQNEIESLRHELELKDEEIERLSGNVPDAPSRGTGLPSLDSELLNSLRQQHALDLSAAHSTIRALETSVFDAEAKSHSMQKQIELLDNELNHLRRGGHNPTAFSPPGSRPGSRTSNLYHTHRFPNLGSSPIPSIFDQVLTPEARHKRKISLGMLKARFDNEVANASSNSHPSSRALSPEILSRRTSVLQTVPETVLKPRWSPRKQNFERPQFMDETHVFWCHACRGDLVIL